MIEEKNRDLIVASLAGKILDCLDENFASCAWHIDDENEHDAMCTKVEKILKECRDDLVGEIGTIKHCGPVQKVITQQLLISSLNRAIEDVFLIAMGYE